MTQTTSCYYDLKADRSPIQGIGVFAGAAIPGRAKIGEITGELISVREARKRARGRSRICLIDLCDKQALDCTRGNILRRLNHSCRPNAFLRIIRTRVEVYALRAIKPGEELTLDYGETPHDNGMQCRCGRPECRSRI
jgi:hypothetical protein